MSIEIRQRLKLNEGEWYVSYVTVAPCGCLFIREKIKLFQVNEPTDKQIQNAVRNKRK